MKIMKIDILIRLIVRFHALFSYYLKSFIKLPPMQIFFRFTYHCNLNCQMCFYNLVVKQKRNYNELTTADWKRIIDEISSFSLITLTGGEPLFRKDSMEIFAYLAQKHRFTIITNGTLVDDEKAEQLVSLAPRYFWQTGLLELAFSLEGTEEIHNKITQRSNSFQKTCDAIRMVQAHKTKYRRKFPSVSIRTVIFKDNVEELPEIIDLAYELGVPRVFFMILDPSEKHLHFFDEATSEPPRERETIDPIDAVLLRNQLAEIRKRASQKGVDVFYSPSMITEEEIIRYYSNDFCLDKYRCYWVFSRASIQATGDVFTCPTFKSGNIQQDSLKNILHNEATRKFHKKVYQNKIFPFCLGCCGMELKKNEGPKDSKQIIDNPLNTP